MSTLKILGVGLAGLSLAALIGGGVLWWYRRRKSKTEEGKRPERAKPSDSSSVPTRDNSPIGDMMDLSNLPDVLRQAIQERHAGQWPPDDATVNALTTDDMLVFAVESQQVGNYTEIRQELITAKVLSVEKTLVRARITGEVLYAEHHGSHAGHGFRVGDLVEVPRSKILVAARNIAPKREGYEAEGPAVRTFKPSNVTKQVYKVRPDTPYDLILPYRTDELEWHIDREMVKMVKIGEKSLLEQVKFSEDSMRGVVTVRALDNDPKEGHVFVARWDFDIAP